MNVRWLVEGKAYTGHFCSAQGLMRHFGSTYSAVVTLTIAIQTFLTIWRLKYLNKTISLIIVSIEFIVVTILLAIAYGIYTNPRKGYYVAPTPYWCWIGDDFLGFKLGAQYVWFWITLGVSLVLYVPLFLLSLGIIKPGSCWYLPKAELTPANLSLAGKDDVPYRARKLWSTVTILYPVLYCILILPLSIVRFKWFFGDESPEERHLKPGNRIATFIVITIFTLSGLLNALLYLLTRTSFFQTVPARYRQDPPPPIKLTNPKVEEA